MLAGLLRRGINGGAGRTLNIIHVPNDAISWPTMMNLCAVF